MRPRYTLLLILLAVLALPAAAWQLVKQTEVLLREGQEHAQLDAASALARALTATAPQLPAPGPAYFVHNLHSPIVLDGARDEWSEYPQTKSADGRVALVLAENAASLYVLLEVKDVTRARADANQPMSASGDRVELAVADGEGLKRFVLGNAAPGALQIAADPTLLGVIRGEWAETAEGYRVEVQLPRPAAGAKLALRVIDQGVGTTPPEVLSLAGGPDPLPLLRPDPRLDRVLAALTPTGARLRVTSAEGWVLARAGELGVSESASASRPDRWRGMLYWLLLAPHQEAASTYAAGVSRLEAPVVWQALSGLPATSVRASGRQSALIVAAAVPLSYEGRVCGALLLEQSSRALLVLADRAVFNVMAMSLLAVMLAATVLFGYAGVLSWRIRRLRDAAERALRPDGRLDPHLPHLAAKGDLGDLSRSFARLLAEVGIYTDYLKTLASKLSHELNTPLAIVRSSLDNLDHEALPEAARTYALRARDGAERLGAILRSMSEASRMERAISAAEGEDFDLAALVRGAGEAYRALLAPRRLDVVVPESPLPFHGAPELVAQALDKLVDNARSFTPEDGWVRIELAPLDDGVRLSVGNQGPLLPAKMHEQLFESLVSVREKAAPVRPGSAPHLGLGLFIVRLVVELHQGVARASNLPGGDGVDFTLALRGMARRRI